MSPKLLDRFRAKVEDGELKPDAMQEHAAERLQALAHQLKNYRPGRRAFFFGAKIPPRGIYLWGDVGRGKSMLMDLFFSEAALHPKRRIHFNAFMVETHGRIHAQRQAEGSADPIPPVARLIAAEASLLCFDEFQVADVADAMILGRLFQSLLAAGVVIVATSNVPPDRLYEGGLNRQLFLPFIGMIRSRFDVVELNGQHDYRQQQGEMLDLYIRPLGADADRRMDVAWRSLSADEKVDTLSLTVLGRTLTIPRAAGRCARFSFDDLCLQALAAADYLTIARRFSTIMIDHVPRMGPSRRNEARRFTILIDTLYDEGVRLICSADAAPDELYTSGDNADSFRRTASRLIEMQSASYLARHAARHAGCSA